MFLCLPDNLLLMILFGAQQIIISTNNIYYLNIFYSQSDNNRTITKSTIIPSPFADEVYANDMK